MKRLCLSIFALILMHSGITHAQSDSARAEQLFNEALKEAKLENYGKACPLFEESYRLNPLLSTLYFRGRCLDKAGKLVAAYERYADYIEHYDKMPPERRLPAYTESYERVKTRKSVMEREIPKAKILAPASLTRGAHLFLDGRELPLASLNTSIAVEIGDHTLRLEVPGNEAREVMFRIERGEQKEITLETESQAAQKKPIPPPIASTAPRPTGPIPKKPTAKNGVAAGGTSAYRIGIYVALGAGGLGLLAGSVTGGLVFGKKQAYDAGCKDSLCNGAGAAAWNEARTLATASEIGFGVGVLGVLSAGALWWMEPSPEFKPSKGVRGPSIGFSTVCMGGVDACIRGAW